MLKNSDLFYAIVALGIIIVAAGIYLATLHFRKIGLICLAIGLLLMTAGIVAQRRVQPAKE